VRLEKIGNAKWNVPAVQRRIAYAIEVEPNPDIRSILISARDLIANFVIELDRRAVTGAEPAQEALVEPRDPELQHAVEHFLWKANDRKRCLVCGSSQGSPHSAGCGIGELNRILNSRVRRGTSTGEKHGM